jgi:hypothetical protein
MVPSGLASVMEGVPDAGRPDGLTLVDLPTRLRACSGVVRVGSGGCGEVIDGGEMGEIQPGQAGDVPDGHPKGPEGTQWGRFAGRLGLGHCPGKVVDQQGWSST